MQVAPSNKDSNEEYTPIIYRIARENNEDYVKQKKRKERRLIRQMVKNVWQDPYHPEICEETCLKAYKQAIGAVPFDPNNLECICPEEKDVETIASCSCDDADVSSDCSSLDLDWEIHFSPPIACQL
ncbi:hypothetical protein K1T71_004166 [Dendrolimus kikuchii]|uniref:Uncharacterized protein n=1 Tax=Dendrolimus kikuchii TaxID=765133 RepID=A0ACC1DB02_9NEOP|nr:hypothetical protein K1T71_004166 [Dendrolimus kikuchii]